MAVDRRRAEGDRVAEGIGAVDGDDVRAVGAANGDAVLLDLDPLAVDQHLDIAAGLGEAIDQAVQLGGGQLEAGVAVADGAGDIDGAVLGQRLQDHGAARDRVGAGIEALDVGQDLDAVTGQHDVTAQHVNAGRARRAVDGQQSAQVHQLEVAALGAHPAGGVALHIDIADGQAIQLDQVDAGGRQGIGIDIGGADHGLEEGRLDVQRLLRQAEAIVAFQAQVGGLDQDHGGIAPGHRLLLIHAQGGIHVELDIVGDDAVVQSQRGGLDDQLVAQ